VYVGGQIDVLASWVMPVLARVPSEGVRIVARPGVAAEVVSSLERGEIDLAFADGPLAERFYESEQLIEYDVVLVTDPARARRIAGLTAEQRAAEVAQGPFVSFNDEMPVLRRLLRAVVGNRSLGRPSLVLPDARGMAEAVAAGAGYAALPRALVRDRLEDGTLAEISHGGRARRARLWVAARRGTTRAPRLAVVLRALREGAARVERRQ
jgi:DNA-binding transcriptional LysR family regulator